MGMSTKDGFPFQVGFGVGGLRFRVCGLRFRVPPPNGDPNFRAPGMLRFGFVLLARRQKWMAWCRLHKRYHILPT